MSNIEIKFQPNPVQRGFIESRAKADLFASRMGEGKSAGLDWAVYYHTRHNPGAAWAYIRDTWENLQATSMKEFFKWFPPGVMGQYNASKKEFVWAEGVGKGTVVFLGMDDPDDASKLQSRELAGIAIDEPAPAAASGGINELIFDIGLSRLRQPGMRWYAVKLAENNPDEGHWTYRRFVDPGTEEYKLWQPPVPENEKNLPDNYYGDLTRQWQHRPDLIARFINGKFGFQQIGRSVTPEWSDELHLARQLSPIKGRDLVLCWDFGLNPTCVITQIAPSGHWNVLHSLVGEGIGIDELCDAHLIPILAHTFRGYRWRHFGDPQGAAREASSAHMTAVRMMRSKIGGVWMPGPQKIHERVEPLRAVLRQLVGGKGLVQVDRRNAPEIWRALRGGWHYNIGRTGVISTEPVKDIHSHPGDALSYGAARLFPLGKLGQKRPSGPKQHPLVAWSGGEGFLGKPDARPAPEARTIGTP